MLSVAPEPVARPPTQYVVRAPTDEKPNYYGRTGG